MGELSTAISYLVLNGRWIGTEQGRPPALLTEGGEYLVPVRKIGVEMGAAVVGDQATQTAVVQFAGREARFTAGSLLAVINGQVITLRSAPELVGDWLYVPAEPLVAFLGARFEPVPGLAGKVLLMSRQEKVWEGVPLMLDPGHGGSDPGAVGASGLQEKEINLRMAVDLRQILTLAGAKALLTRETDRYLSLRSRAEMANKAEVKYFVAIHNNWVSEPAIRGTETYYYLLGYGLARRIQEELVAELGWPNRGVKEAGFYVLRHTRMPAVLCEVGFLSNPEEEQALADPIMNLRASTAIYRGIRCFLEENSGNY